MKAVAIPVDFPGIQEPWLTIDRGHKAGVSIGGYNTVTGAHHGGVYG
jgi:hypothetical protein